MKLLHCADLHLSRSEEEYSFSVLDEILSLAAKEACGALLFAGDVFDSRADLEALRERFRKALDALPAETGVYLVPGNHESLGAASEEDLCRFDFGRARLLADKPYSLLPLGKDAELLALPFRRDYGDYRDWPVPEKKAAFRVLLAHGTVSGMTYAAPDAENDSGVLDADLPARLLADYAALGHIHGGTQAAPGGVCAAYPGSARVWREGEAGPRRALLVSTARIPPVVEARDLLSAGRFISLPLEAGLDGALPDIDGASGLRPPDLGPADWVRIEASGLVEDETAAVKAVDELAARLGKRCRKVTKDFSGLSVFAGISSHPLAARFLEAWGKTRNDYAGPPEVLRAARLEGLKVLKDLLEARK